VAVAVLLMSCPTVDEAAQCRDGRTNGAETDVDCGGGCGPCAPSRLCLTDEDCASEVCTLNRCAMPTCDDGVMNGNETGPDCGGACPACTGGCIRNSDCGGAGVCFDGMCGPGPCSAPLAICAQACVDTRVDPLNCGGCNQPCTGGEACVAGLCRAVCTGGTRQCGPACVDVGSDPFNCGMCMRACSPAETCIGGSCFPRCAPGQTDCAGLCVSTDSDPQHCGGCGRPCAPGSGCLNGQCTPGCMPPLLPCDGGATCVDPRFDPNNCNYCGNVCPFVPNAQRACGPMGCGRSACNPGYADCDAGTNDGCESFLPADLANCGVCGHPCFGSELCIMGRCCGPLPMGSYLTTCTMCEACNGLLTCLCDDAMQIPRLTSFPFPTCPTNITNCNGVLQCNGC